MEPIDVYADQFQIVTGPFGCTLSFLMSHPTPPAPGAAPQTDRLASVRMSMEHLKTMAFMLHRQISQYERQTATTIPMPVEVLNTLNIGPEDWDAFWKRQER